MTSATDDSPGETPSVADPEVVWVGNGEAFIFVSFLGSENNDLAWMRR